MPSIDYDANPGDVRWPVIRGDDENLTMQFFTTYVSPGHASNVPLDVTGRTYVSSVATGRGGTVIANPTVTVTAAATGEVTVAMTDTQTMLLTSSTYLWDLVENPNSTSESTLITGRMTVAGRATP